MAAKMLALHKSQHEYLALADALNDDGVSWTGRLAPMHPNFLERGINGPIGVWLREAARNGFIQTPKEFQ